MKNEEFAAAGIKMENKETMSLRPCGFPFVSSFVWISLVWISLLRSCGFVIRTHLYIIITHKIGLTLRADYKSARTKGEETTFTTYYFTSLLLTTFTTFTTYYLYSFLQSFVL